MNDDKLTQLRSMEQSDSDNSSLEPLSGKGNEFIMTVNDRLSSATRINAALE